MRNHTRLCRTVLLAAALLFAGELAAQGLPSIFGKSRANNQNRSADIPTNVTATSMDIDMGRNIATLLGDVFVDDQDMSISCDKMIIRFADKDQPKKADESADEAKDGDQKAKKAKADDSDKDDAKKADDDAKDDKEKNDDIGNTVAGGKRPTSIECYGNVVITAKQKDPNAEQKDQKATAGKAVYDLIKDEIILTENPVLNRDGSKVVGNKIILIVKEERMIVLHGSASTTEVSDQLNKQ